MHRRLRSIAIFCTHLLSDCVVCKRFVIPVVPLGKLHHKSLRLEKLCLMTFKHFKCNHKNFKCGVCVFVSDVPQSVGNVYGCERIFSRPTGRAVISVFMCLGQFVFNERKRGFLFCFVLFFSWFPCSSLICQPVSGHKQCECTRVSAS